MAVFLRVSRSGGGGLVALLASLMMLLGGCVLSAPSAADFEQDAAQALDDLASAVATVKIVLEQHRTERMFAASTVVMLTESEEAGEKAVQDLAALQPPAGLHETYGQITAALQDGADLLTEVRIAAVAVDTAALQQLSAELANKRAELSDLSEHLR